ncbi:unnamed protein product [Larinioides sclopetarius]|uniref:BTB domain-containing protein n=1 Tax=Larinioides sclopetarius TaxID=280406 RepID=A0AAV2AAY4_9ARAC
MHLYSVLNMQSLINNCIYRVRSNTLQKRLFADLEKSIFTDITFMVGQKGNRRNFKAHRLVLASENPEFENMLHGSDESGTIKISDIHPKGFENLIRYYYGESFLFKDLASIRETCLAAEKFKANQLQLIAEDNLIDLLKSESLIKILNVCIELNMPRAKERCLEAISARFENVLKTEELISAPLEVIKQILGLCSDRGLDFKISAICTLLAWAERHECPDIITRRLLSMVQYEHIPSDVIISFFRRKDVPLMESQIRVVPEGHSSKKTWSLIKDLLLKSTNMIRNTVVHSLEHTKAESSEVEQETSLGGKEIFTDEVETYGLKNKKETGVDREAPEPEGEKISEVDYDPDEDYSVIEEEVINDFMQEASKLITCSVTNSSRETVNRIISVTEELTKQAAEKMQKAIDEMEDSFKYLIACNSNTSKNTEV